jgi:hypothetical protein
MKSRSKIGFSKLTIAKTTLVAVAVALGGCASGSVALRPNAADVRGKAIIAGAGAHAIASGPARLLHVDVLSGRGVNIYTVQAKQDGSADCQARALGEVASLHRDSNEVNLELAPGEVACLSLTDGAAARADVAWHARQAAGPTVFVAQR